MLINMWFDIKINRTVLQFLSEKQSLEILENKAHVLGFKKALEDEINFIRIKIFLLFKSFPESSWKLIIALFCLLIIHNSINQIRPRKKISKLTLTFCFFLRDDFPLIW